MGTVIYEPLPNLLEIPRTSRTLDYRPLVAVSCAEVGNRAVCFGAVGVLGGLGVWAMKPRKPTIYGWLVLIALAGCVAPLVIWLVEWVTQ